MTIIVADTTCGLPRKLLEERCIPLIPKIVTFGEHSYKEAQALVEELKSQIPLSCIPIYELPPAIIVHAGPKAIGVGFFLE